MASNETWRDLSFEGKSAIVTGAARGIGRAMVFQLAGLGARVMLWDVDEQEAKRATTELVDALTKLGRPARIEYRKVDVTALEQVTRAADEFAAEGLDVLINNAGTTSVQAADKMPLAVWEATIKVNLTGTYYCCRAAIPHLKRRPGSAIVNISSSSALVGGGGGAHYAASKAAVDGLTRQLARELAPETRVNAIQPRTIETDLFNARYADSPASRDALLQKIPLKRFGQPEDIAAVAVFLASDLAGYVTGQIVLVDGGRTYQ
jgi:3-oxoacyl-[acyl-carrier protein] reductase